MPGFFEFMKRMVTGAPVFEDENSAGRKPSQDPVLSPPSPSGGPTIRKQDQNSFPVVYVKRTATHVSGTNMDVYCEIVNTWQEEVLLDKITFANTKREIDAYLHGGEEREFLVYRGPKLQKQYYEAQLDYKTREEGDYFRAVHDVKCAYHADDKTYTIDEMRLRRPIRDIYG